MEGYIFDYRLGYVRDNCPLAGFDIIGEENAPLGKIVTLGGYTTPVQALNNNSWADVLYKQAGGKYQVLNGCTDGYASAHILMMFIREVILFEPKTVVILSGFHNMAYYLGLIKDKKDAAFLKTHPFATPGHLSFFRKITSRFGLGNDEVFYGLENNSPAFETWLKQMAEIKCLCDEFGLNLKVLLQPCVFSGNYEMNDRERAFSLEFYDITEKELKAFSSAFKEQYKEIQKRLEGLDYIKDLSGVFDGYKDVYTDAYHVKDESLTKLTEGAL